MIPLKTISIQRNDRACPRCGWRPDREEGSARYEDLLNHVEERHGMGKPIFTEKTIFLNGYGAHMCEVAIFINFGVRRL